MDQGEDQGTTTGAVGLLTEDQGTKNSTVDRGWTASLDYQELTLLAGLYNHVNSFTCWGNTISRDQSWTSVCHIVAY